MVDRGVSGVEDAIDRRQQGGSMLTTEMRVGDRAIRITEPVSLRADRQRRAMGSRRLKLRPNHFIPRDHV